MRNTSLIFVLSKIILVKGEIYMDLRDRVNVVQAKMNGAVAALTYGYFSHTNDAGGTTVDIGTDIKAVNINNIAIPIS